MSQEELFEKMGGLGRRTSGFEKGKKRRGLLELRVRRVPVLLNPNDHGEDAGSRLDFDERVHAKAEEGQRLVGDTEANGDQSLGECRAW
jgi:hypothetical protein